MRAWTFGAVIIYLALATGSSKPDRDDIMCRGGRTDRAFGWVRIFQIKATAFVSSGGNKRRGGHGSNNVDDLRGWVSARTCKCILSICERKIHDGCNAVVRLIQETRVQFRCWIFGRDFTREGICVPGDIVLPERVEVADGSICESLICHHHEIEEQGLI